LANASFSRSVSADDGLPELGLIGITQTDEDAVSMGIDSQLAIAGSFILSCISFLEEKGLRTEAQPALAISETQADLVGRLIERVCVHDFA